MSELNIDPIDSTLSWQIYLDAKKLDEEIEDLLSIANNPSATPEARELANVKLSTLPAG